MRLLSFVAQLVMVWIPLAVAVLLFGFAFYVRSPAPAVQGGIVVLVVALYKAIEWGVSTRAKTKRSLRPMLSGQKQSAGQAAKQKVLEGR